jgi:protease I
VEERPTPPGAGEDAVTGASGVPPRLRGRRIALLAATGVHEHEFWVPYYRFKEEGASVAVCGARQGAIYRGEGRHGQDGLDLARTEATCDEVDPESLDALVIPGGIYGPLALRANAGVLGLIRALHSRGKVIGAICHGQWVMVSAGILRGRKATSPGDIAVDLTNAGAEWVDQEAVRDGNLITAVYFGYLPAFLRLLIEAIEETPPAQL